MNPRIVPFWAAQNSARAEEEMPGIGIWPPAR